MNRQTVTLGHLNECDRDEFVRVCGPLFEHSPWVAQRTFARRPFGDIESLHCALVDTLAHSTREEQLNLIASHPDLVGSMAREGRLTRESTAEQRAAGLTDLSEDEIVAFDRFNAAYREKFGFPFVICARENKRDAILASFPVRLNNSMDQEIETALVEIAKIARLRLNDAVILD